MMDLSAPTNLIEIAKAVGALATPIAVAIVAYLFQRRQRTLEAAMTERIKRIGAISPYINKIFSYRQRVGSFLDYFPDEILEAKREADREFWTYEYLWSKKFKGAYHKFMHESFTMNNGQGKKANINAKSEYYPKKATDSKWKAFEEIQVNEQRNQTAYDEVQSAIANDLGFRA